MYFIFYICYSHENDMSRAKASSNNDTGYQKGDIIVAVLFLLPALETTRIIVQCHFYWYVILLYLWMAFLQCSQEIHRWHL